MERPRQPRAGRRTWLRLLCAIVPPTALLFLLAISPRPTAAAAPPNTWNATGAMGVPRGEFAMTLMADGRVLAAGGATQTPGALPTSSAEIYSPWTRQWTATPGAMVTAREHATATTLSGPQCALAATAGWICGTVVMIGGDTGPGTAPLRVIDAFDPSFVDPVACTQGRWTSSAGLAISRTFHSATLMRNGFILVAGGQDGTGAPLNSSELVDPATGLASFGPGLQSARSGHTATLLADGRVLLAGGRGALGPIPDAEVYDPMVNRFIAVGSMVTARQGATATLLPDGDVLVAGGTGAGGAWLSSAELFDPSTGAWSSTGSLGGAFTNRAAALLDDGRVLVTGGTGAAGISNDAALYDPATRLWTSVQAMGSPRSSHAAVALTTGEMLVAGGYAGGNAPATSAEVYTGSKSAALGAAPAPAPGLAACSASSSTTASTTAATTSSSSSTAAAASSTATTTTPAATTTTPSVSAVSITGSATTTAVSGASRLPMPRPQASVRPLAALFPVARLPSATPAARASQAPARSSPTPAAGAGGGTDGGLSPPPPVFDSLFPPAPASGLPWWSVLLGVAGGGATVAAGTEARRRGMHTRLAARFAGLLGAARAHPPSVDDETTRIRSR